MTAAKVDMPAVVHRCWTESGVRWGKLLLCLVCAPSSWLCPPELRPV